MKICVLGVARSGTTALYNLLQEIILDRSDNKVEFVYEPFLWEKEYFNDRFNLVSDNFSAMDSISFEGIHNHLKLPLLIRDPKLFKDNEYLNRLLNPPGKNQPHILSKFIRAAGRYLLLNAIAPDTKFLFIIRNPADSVNSIALNFSFFGGEFHRDDFPRFINEINRFFGAKREAKSFTTRVEKELFFWYYMNRFALESFTKVSSRPLILCHEEILKHRDQCVRIICDYLGVPFKPTYRELFMQEVGPIIKERRASQLEMELYDHYMRIYSQLLAEHSVVFNFKIDEILKQYTRVEKAVVRTEPEYGLTTLGIMKRFKEAKTRSE